MNIESEIRSLADRYAAELKSNIDVRVKDMEQDDRSMFLFTRFLC